MMSLIKGMICHLNVNQRAAAPSSNIKTQNWKLFENPLINKTYINQTRQQLNLTH